MSFVDTLSGLPNKNIEYISQAKQAAIDKMVDIAEEAVKYASTESAKRNRKSVSGFVCFFRPKSEEAGHFSLVQQWEDTLKARDFVPGFNLNIFRIDRLGYSFEDNLSDNFEMRYPVQSCPDSISSAFLSQKYEYLSQTEISSLVSAIEKRIRTLGFSTIEVKAVSKQFYKYTEISKHGFFGLKHSFVKHDDKVGKVLYICVSW